jgi:1,2-dihydroxy-3-keto-5-methylthiopentene dioxygenase
MTVLTTTENGAAGPAFEYPMAPDEDWPAAWYMAPDEEMIDQCLPNQCTPNRPVDAAAMKNLGICYWKMPDVTNYTYPTISVPWNPSDAKDPKLQALRDDRGYSYADIITVHPDHLVRQSQALRTFENARVFLTITYAPFS